MSAVSALCVVSMFSMSGFLVIAFLFARHAKEERENSLTFAKEAFAHIKADTPKDAAEAKAIEAYQAEALREHRIQFENDLGKPEREEPSRPSIVRAATGEEFEVIHGVD